nr:unnamed protein product [Callosobruchus analis]
MAVETSDFVTSVKHFLKEGDTEAVMTVFSDEKNQNQIVNSSWDLIHILTEYLTGHYEGNNETLFKCCEKLLGDVADISNPEEAVLQFIEEIERGTDDTQFLTLLRIIPKVICRISQKRLNSIGWCYNAIQSYLRQCEIPDYDGLSGKDKLLLDSDDRVQRILYLYSEILHLHNEFLEKLTTLTNETCIEHICVTKKFLVQLLGKPLIYLDMEIFNNVKSKARLIAENIVDKILDIDYDPTVLSIRKHVDEINNFDEGSIDTIASLFYLIFGEGVYIHRVPKVYHPYFFFYNTLHLAAFLLECDHQIVVEKGMKLSIVLLQHVQYNKLPSVLLDSEDPKKFLLALSKVIIYNKLDILRNTALDIYKKFITSFDCKGKYLLLYNIMDHLNHSGLKGFTITLFKEELALQLQLNDLMSCYYRGRYLFKILDKICYLHKKEKSDLIEISDQIIATLNLLRYLILADTYGNSFYMYYLHKLDELFFIPLREGICLSRVHYELKIKEILEDSGTVIQNNSFNNMNVMVGSEDLALLSKDEKLRVLNMSLTSFDVMDSLLSRVEEIITLKHPSLQMLSEHINQQFI